jgi:ubiquinone/menaquinone biosynthesis C-methylase UbiE
LVSNINGHRFPEERSINVISGFAEDRSLKNHSYDFGSIVTTVCCLNDIPEAFSKIDRILKRNCLFIIGLVDAKRELEKKVICYISSIEKG